MTNKGPEWQAVFGPISTAELIKGKLLSKSRPKIIRLKIGSHKVPIFV